MLVLIDFAGALQIDLDSDDLIGVGRKKKRVKLW